MQFSWWTFVLQAVNFTIAPGEVVALVGPSGAGKTTLIGCITGLIQRFSGSITVGGYDVLRDYPVVRQLLGLVPQELNFDGFFKSRNVLEYQGGFFGVRDYRKRARDLLEAFSLSEKAESNSRWLSGGMKRRLMICKALMHKPALLFLDEPTTGVDAVSRKEFWEMLKRLKEWGITILVSTPYMDEAAMCDRVALMQEGNIMKIDTPEDIIQAHKRPLVAVKTDNMFSLVEDLRSMDDCYSAFRFGDSIHFSPKNILDEESLKENLHAKGHRDVTVGEIEPGIEDCFMELMIVK